MIYILLLLYFIAKTLYKSLIFAVFMPIKEKIANTFVSAILNSNGAARENRTLMVSHTPLKRTRLPIPPWPQHIYIKEKLT